MGTGHCEEIHDQLVAAAAHTAFGIDGPEGEPSMHWLLDWHQPQAFMELEHEEQVVSKPHEEEQYELPGRDS
jgi:hypothetical protein